MSLQTTELLDIARQLGIAPRSQRLDRRNSISVQSPIAICAERLHTAHLWTISSPFLVSDAFSAFAYFLLLRYLAISQVVSEPSPSGAWLLIMALRPLPAIHPNERKFSYTGQTQLSSSYRRTLADQSISSCKTILRIWCFRF